MFLWFRQKVVSDSLWPHGLQSARLLCPWDFPGKNTWVGKFFPLFPSIGDLPDSRIKPASPALTGGFFTTEPSGKPNSLINCALIQFASNFHLYLLGPWLIHRGSVDSIVKHQVKAGHATSPGEPEWHWNYRMSSAAGANVRSARWEWWSERHPHHWRAFLPH